MRIYAHPSRLLWKQIGFDIALVVWIVVWYLLARWVHAYIAGQAVPVRDKGQEWLALETVVRASSTGVGQLPAIGGLLSQPLVGLSQQVGSLADAANRTAQLISGAATVLAVIIFGVPTVIALVKWVPWRIASIRTTYWAGRLLAGDDALELFALRALATAPMSQLARLGTNPMRAWMTGDSTGIRQLANLELDRCGLRAPNWTRTGGGSATLSPAARQAAAVALQRGTTPAQGSPPHGQAPDSYSAATAPSPGNPPSYSTAQWSQHGFDQP